MTALLRYPQIKRVYVAKIMRFKGREEALGLSRSNNVTPSRGSVAEAGMSLRRRRADLVLGPWGCATIAKVASFFSLVNKRQGLRREMRTTCLKSVGRTGAKASRV